jgi:polyhydroxybutyrate depolymerase
MRKVMLGLLMLQGGCATGYQAGKTQVVSLEHHGEKRSFRVHLPPGYDSARPAPLVMMFHGGFGNARHMERDSGMNAVADREGFLVAYLDGSGFIPTWNAGRCCGGAQRNNVDDVGFAAAVLERIEQDLSVDTHRVYAAGMSNGAMMAHRLACERADLFAGIAAVAGTNMFESCSPSRPVPVLHMHGSLDAHVPWNGGVGCGASSAVMAGVPATIDGWAQHDACTGPSLVTRKEGSLTCENRGSCTGGADVVLCTMDGSGHHWPGGGGTPKFLEATCREDGPNSTDIAGAEVIWDFLKQHTLP